MNPARFFIFLMSAFIPMSEGDKGQGCKRSDVNFISCVVDNMNNQKMFIKIGMPRLKIGPLDPLVITQIRLKQGKGPVSIDLMLTNQTLRGIKDYRLESATIDLENYKMEFNVSLPKLSIEGMTKVGGRILVLPINGDGFGYSNYTRVRGRAVLLGHPTRRTDKVYFSLDKIKFDLAIDKGIMHMDELFNGNKQIADAMNTFMADNWEVVFKELKPVIATAVEAIVEDVASKILNHHSLDDMFPK